MAKNVERVRPITSTERERQFNAARAVGPEVLHPQEFHTTSDQLRIFRAHQYVGGVVDHGTVASADAMSALGGTVRAGGTIRAGTATRGVWPGDTCWRSDESVQYQCISGSDSSAVWRVVVAPPPAAILASQLDTDPTLAANSDERVPSQAAVVSALAAKQDTPANAVTLGKITEAAGLPLWNGAAWPGGGGSGSTFGPATLASLAAWYKADVGLLNSGGTAAATGDSIATWQDQSGSGHHLTQSTAGRRPVLTASAFGAHAAPLFDGVDDYLINTTGPTIALANCTVVAYVRSLNNVASKRFVVLGPNGATGQDYSSTTRCMLGQAGGSDYAYWWANNSTVAIAGARPAPIGAYVGRSRNSVLRVTDSGTVWSSTVVATSLGNAVGVLLAAYYNAGTIDPTFGVNGYISEVCIYGRALSDYEIGQLVSYLDARWS